MKKAAALLILSFLCVTAHAQIDLKYNLKKGQTFKIATVSDQNVEQEIMGTAMEVQQSFMMGISYEVTKASGNVFDVKCTYYRVSFNSSAMGVEVSYDSEDPPLSIDPSAMGFAALVGKSFMMKFNASGEVLEVTGFEQMINQMVDDMGELTDEMKAATKEQLKGQFGGDQLTKTMEQSLKVFPSSGKAKKGEKWSISSTLGMYAMDITSDYVLTDFDKKTATVDVFSEIAPSSFTQNQGGMEMEMEMSGTQSGQFVIDRSTGMLSSGKIIQDLTATATMMGMTVPMKIKSENSFVRED